MQKDIKEIFSKNLKELMNRNGDNLTILSDALGISYSTVSDWMHGNKMARSGGLQKIANHYNVNISDLTTEHDFKTLDILSTYNKLNESNQSKVIDFSKELLKEQNSKIVDLREWQDIDLYSTLSAGTGVVDLEPTHIERISYNGYVPKHYDMAFRVQGDSMEPFFEDGEVIFVESDSEVRNGQFGAVLVNGEAYIKKMYIDNNILRLVSLNKKYDDIIATENDEISVVGRVII